MAWELTSSAFKAHEEIPQKYTCQGQDVSPPLQWERPPAFTITLALICDDPDAPAGDWVHWVAWNIPPTPTSLAEGVPKTAALPNGAVQGITDFRRPGYGGPCPPPGKPHRYFFKLYALDTKLNLPAKSTKADLVKAMQGHILAETELIGKYQRR